MNDFIFGTLATDDLRLAHERRLRSGITHNHARFPRDPAPGQPVTLELSVGPVHFCDRAWIYWATGSEDPGGAGGRAVVGQALEMELVDVAWDTLLWGYRRRFRGVIPGQPAGTLVRYRIAAQCTAGEPYADQGAYYAFYVDDDPLPNWTRDAVVYQIFVDRFNPGDGQGWLAPANPSGFYGGTLRGITEKMDYIAGLGVDALWLSPIFPSPSHHGYDATDYYEIEPRLGNKADLRELLDAAHARGLRVLLDFVANHWSYLHATFQDAIQNANSPYRSWYTFTDWPTKYETFFGVRDLPQINLRNAEARQHLLDAARYWLEFGVDGYRLDYAIGPAPDFWAEFRQATRRIRPDCWTFGEVVDPPDVQLSFEGLLDGCLDFVLLEAMRQTFAFGRWDAARFADFLERHEAYFPLDFSRPSFLDSHDMNRILWAVQGDQRRLKLAALCQFSLQGPPVVYYGTEVGLSQERDVRQGTRGILEEARLPMLWGEAQDREMLAFYRALIVLRRARPALCSGTRQTLLVGEHILAYQRTLAEDQIAAVFNLSEQAQSVFLWRPSTELLLSTGPGVRVLSQAGGVQVELPPLGGALLSGS